MIGALSSSPAFGTVNPDAALGTLDAQIASYEVKLADWVNCPSCKTAEGKAKIADIRSKIAGLKQQKQAIEQRQPSKRTQFAAPADLTAWAIQHRGNHATPASHSPRPTGPLGGQVDVYA